MDTRHQMHVGPPRHERWRSDGRAVSEAIRRSGGHHKREPDAWGRAEPAVRPSGMQLFFFSLSCSSLASAIRAALALAAFSVQVCCCHALSSTTNMHPAVAFAWRHEGAGQLGSVDKPGGCGSWVPGGNFRQVSVFIVLVLVVNDQPSSSILPSPPPIPLSLPLLFPVVSPQTLVKPGLGTVPSGKGISLFPHNRSSSTHHPLTDLVYPSEVCCTQWHTTRPLG